MTRPADEQRENAECEKCQTFESEQTLGLRRVSRVRVGGMVGCGCSVAHYCRLTRAPFFVVEKKKTKTKREIYEIHKTCHQKYVACTQFLCRLHSSLHFNISSDSFMIICLQNYFL